MHTIALHAQALVQITNAFLSHHQLRAQILNFLDRSDLGVIVVTLYINLSQLLLQIIDFVFERLSISLIYSKAPTAALHVFNENLGTRTYQYRIL